MDIVNVIAAIGGIIGSLGGLGFFTWLFFYKNKKKISDVEATSTESTALIANVKQMEEVVDRYSKMMVGYTEKLDEFSTKLNKVKEQNYLLGQRIRTLIQNCNCKKTNEIIEILKEYEKENRKPQ